MQPFKALNINLVHGYHMAGRGFSDSWVVNPGVRARGNCDAIEVTEEGHAFICFESERKWIPMGNIKGATPLKAPVKLADADAEVEAVLATIPAKFAELSGLSDSGAQSDANKSAPKAAAKKTTPAATAGA